MSISWTRLPFRYTTDRDYEQNLSAWLGEVFEERLPRNGYQVREQQLYFSFRVASALTAGARILAEAGSGTGKTFAYLLPAVCTSRLRGRPVVVATATPALQEQLAGPAGDIATISRLLDLEIEARVAQRPEDVVCDLRVERFASDSQRVRGKAALLRWAENSPSGVRSEYPEASDRLWAQVAWNPACRCDICPRRGYCRLMKGRAEVRRTPDLVICSHDLFFSDTLRSDRRPPGQLPVLPPFSGVVFDEGHRVAAAAQRAAGARFRPAEVRAAIRGCRVQGARIRLLAVSEAAEHALDAMVNAVVDAMPPTDAPVPERLLPSDTLCTVADVLRRTLGVLQDEIAIEDGLQAGTGFSRHAPVYQFRLDEATRALQELARRDQTVAWVAGGAIEVVPRDLTPVWDAILPPHTPLVFSSATLSVDGSFAYSARTLGLDAPRTARVGVPFRLARQVRCWLAPSHWSQDPDALILGHLLSVLRATRGRALVLLPSAAETAWLRPRLVTPFPVLWEGDAGLDAQVVQFRRRVASVLCSHSLWEGIDIPGEALSAVVVPWLPFPSSDPVTAARREDAARQGEDPLTAVDIPAMVLRLRQGVGRLIRQESDRGVVAVLDPRMHEEPYRSAVHAALPEGAPHVRSLRALTRFLDASTLTSGTARGVRRSRSRGRSG